METYTELKELVDNPNYQDQRRKTLSGLTDDMIDEPILEIINGFNKLTYCFTLQCCYGHFVYEGQKNPQNVEPLPIRDGMAKVEYRIAYIAMCIENSAPGRAFFKVLKKIPTINPENVQFCCAEWFWEKQVNSYVLQVEPDRFKREDTATIDYNEALNAEKIRNKFFKRIENCLKR
ncbi:MAG: hypothetical protein K9L30_16290 [Desulfobacterales bacterium]|nr:hypothetical protein [Desulfobacterales bacterium]